MENTSVSAGMEVERYNTNTDNSSLPTCYVNVIICYYSPPSFLRQCHRVAYHSITFDVAVMFKDLCDISDVFTKHGIRLLCVQLLLSEVVRVAAL